MGSKLFETILKARHLEVGSREAFLHPSYEETSHDPFLLPDMQLAVDRLVTAHQRQELIYIYGDYDIDGLTATTILLKALKAFDIPVKTFIPNRFVDGYGLSRDAIERLSKEGAELIMTVDCGSLSHEEIKFANELGMEVIVTDHHSVAETMPSAVAVVNPKRSGHAYPFIDLAGCGVAFKLVQALQTKLNGLPKGQEKWLLDLVALGTVCDVVTLLDENRANVHWGLKVMQKTRRPGIKAMALVAGLDLQKIQARSLGFVIGPHLNAAGRLETAQLSLDLLTTEDSQEALTIAYQLQDMNKARRAEQDRITKEAKVLAGQFEADPVLVLADPSWSHGIIGIVAAKMLETFKKPTFVLQEMGAESKGSARSYGDFSAVEGIRAADEWLIKGGGHKLAAGVTLKTEHIPHFRKAINDFYNSLGLANQEKHLYPVVDAELDDLSECTLELMQELQKLEPYGHGNPEPTLRLKGMKVIDRREMGADKQHIKLQLQDKAQHSMFVIAFNQADAIKSQPGDVIDAWVQLTENEWRDRRTVEGRILRIS